MPAVVDDRTDYHAGRTRGLALLREARFRHTAADQAVRDAPRPDDRGSRARPGRPGRQRAARAGGRPGGPGHRPTAGAGVARGIRAHPAWRAGAGDSAPEAVRGGESGSHVQARGRYLVVVARLTYRPP